MSAPSEPPPRQRKGPARHTPGPINSKNVVTDVVFTPDRSLLTMATRLVDDGVMPTPVRSKIVVARIADRLRRGQAVSAAEIGVLREMYHRRQAELEAAASWFTGCT